MVIYKIFSLNRLFIIQRLVGLMGFTEILVISHLESYDFLINNKLNLGSDKLIPLHLQTEDLQSNKNRNLLLSIPIDQSNRNKVKPDQDRHKDNLRYFKENEVNENTNCKVTTEDPSNEKNKNSFNSPNIIDNNMNLKNNITSRDFNRNLCSPNKLSNENNQRSQNMHNMSIHDLENGNVKYSFRNLNDTKKNMNNHYNNTSVHFQSHDDLIKSNCSDDLGKMANINNKPPIKKKSDLSKKFSMYGEKGFLSFVSNLFEILNSKDLVELSYRQLIFTEIRKHSKTINQLTQKASIGIFSFIFTFSMLNKVI